MNQNSFHRLQIGLGEVSRLLVPFAIIWLLGSIGLGWLVKSFFILLGLVILLPVIGFVGLQWWLSRNLVQSVCPVCRYESMALNQSEFNCPSCGEPLRVEHGSFHRLTPPGTIDVDAIEVPSRSVSN